MGRRRRRSLPTLAERNICVRAVERPIPDVEGLAQAVIRSALVAAERDRLERWDRERTGQSTS